MKFRKIIDIPQSPIRIDHKTRIVLFGSCFAENIGKFLSDNQFHVRINPFGVLYNPYSIQLAIDILLEGKVFTEHDVFEEQGSFHTFFHHSSFSGNDKTVFLENINFVRETATHDLKNADLILLTFGTSYVFRHKMSRQIVANCHKQPASMFERFRLSIDDIVQEWGRTIRNIRSENPTVKFLFTVSPIRHWKDGAHGNQLSKAILLLAIDQLVESYEEVYYFPSYEIVMDELRDYRFYNEDMLHPNDLAIRYIGERFSDTFFDKQTQRIIKEWQKIYKAISHKSFNEKAEEYKQFLRQTLLKMSNLKDKYPYFECENELLTLTNKLSTKNEQ